MKKSLPGLTMSLSAGLLLTLSLATSVSAETLKCTTDAFSGGPDNIVEATMTRDESGKWQLTMIVKATGQVITGPLRPDDEFQDGLLWFDENVEKSSGFEASASFHNPYYLATRPYKSHEYQDILKCE